MIPDEHALVALSLLLPEFAFTDTKAVDARIKEQLKRKKLGEFDPLMIASLRHFKNIVQAELYLASKSRYFTHTHGTYCDRRDFDLDQMAKELVVIFPNLSRSVIDLFLAKAILYYYLK